MTDFLFPYLKLRLHPGTTAEAPQDRMHAVHMALAASQEELITPSCHSLNLEAGVLGGQALGEVMPGIREVPPLAQILYEQLFFDIRHFLSNPDTVCRLLLNDRNRFDHRGGYDWQCKIIAYGVGFEEYLNWRSNKPSVAARAVLLACKDTLLYLSGLSLLGKKHPDDFVEAHCRLFGMLPDIVSRAGEIVDAGIKRKYHDHTEKDIETAAAMIPDMIT